MSDVEKLIEAFEALSHDDRISDTEINGVLSILKSLQPSDNGELVELWRGVKGKIDNPPLYKIIENCDRQSETLVWLVGKTIAALSAPKPFDVLQHLRDGGKITRPSFKSDEFWHMKHQNLIWCDDTEASCLGHLLVDFDDWQPYTEPEPTPAELIEDARIEVMNILENKSYNKQERADKFTVIIDKFEKLTLETSSE